MHRRRLADTHFAFIDVETTGIDPAGSRVVEVACQRIERGALTSSFESLVDPGCPIPALATAIHGIRDDDVRGRPALNDLAPALVELCAGAIVVAHNAAFDRRFLPFLADRPSACSWRLAARVVPEAPNHRNQTLRAFFGVRDPSLDGRRPHRALSDVIVTRHVFFRCIERYLFAGHEDSDEALLRFLAARPSTPPSRAGGFRTDAAGILAASAL